MKKFLILFILLNFFLNVFFIDISENANTIARALPVITYFENHSFNLDKYHDKTYDISFVNNHYYPQKAPLLTFTVIPIAGFLKCLGVINNQNGSIRLKDVYIIGDILCGIIPFVLIIILIFIYSDKFVFRNISCASGHIAFIWLFHFYFRFFVFCPYIFFLMVINILPISKKRKIYPERNDARFGFFI